MEEMTIWEQHTVTLNKVSFPLSFPTFVPLLVLIIVKKEVKLSTR